VRTLIWIVLVVVVGMLLLSFGLLAVRGVLGLLGVGNEPARIVTVETVR
jgi:hypothetical protein